MGDIKEYLELLKNKPHRITYIEEGGDLCEENIVMKFVVAVTTELDAHEFKSFVQNRASCWMRISKNLKQYKIYIYIPSIKINELESTAFLETIGLIHFYAKYCFGDFEKFDIISEEMAIDETNNYKDESKPFFRKIGFWKERGYEENNFEEEFFFNKKTNQEAVDYLEKGHLVIYAPNMLECLICKNVVSGTSSIYTDGVWLWTDEVVHYYKEHSLALPQDFKNHIKDEKYKVPELSEEELLRISESL